MKYSYINLSFLPKVLTSPVQWTHVPLVGSSLWSASCRHGHSTWLLWAEGLTVLSLLPATHISSVPCQGLWFMTVSKERLWLTKIVALLRPCCFSQEKIRISPHLDGAHYNSLVTKPLFLTYIKRTPTQSILDSSQIIFLGVLISFVSLWQNTWDNWLWRRKDLFWFTVSVHGLLAPLLWTCGGIVHHGGTNDRGDLFIMWQPGSKDRERRGTRIHSPSDLTSSCYKLGPKPSIQGTLEESETQTKAFEKYHGVSSLLSGCLTQWTVSGLAYLPSKRNAFNIIQTPNWVSILCKVNQMEESHSSEFSGIKNNHILLAHSFLTNT
jgi:hypothetical protein